MNPVRYQAQEDRTLYFCGCKATAKPPFCDGSHKA
jgi:CDGSH-type Zn-finger protein